MCAFALNRSCRTSVGKTALLCTAAIVVASGSVRAEDHLWSSLSGGSFNYWLNWVPNWVPQEDDRAIFDLGMDPAYEVTFYESVTNDECLFRTDKVILDLGGFTYTLDHPGFALIVGEDAGHVAEVLFYNGTIDTTVTHVGLWDDSAGTLDLESGLTLNASDHLVVGNDGDGLMYVRDGASVTTEYAAVGGHDFGNTGVLNVDGPDAEFTVNEILRVGDSGYGFLNLLNGARVSSQGCYVGDSLSGQGEVRLTGESEFDGGNWVALGCSGTGLLDVTQASQFSTGDFFVGTTPDGSASVTLSDAGSRIDAGGYLIVGDWGYVTMNVSQQAAVTANILVVGACETSDGELNISGSGTTVSVLGSIQSAGGGVGAINITGGADVRSTETDGTIYVGLAAGSDGYLLLDGASMLTAEESALVVGDVGHGIMDILNGSEVHTANELFMGWCEGSFGQLTISGEGSVYTSDTGYPAHVGDGGEGTLIITDGGHFEKPGGVRLGLQSTGVGTVTLSGSGSAFKCGEHLGVGEYGTGIFTVNHGRVAVGEVDPADVPSGEVHVGGWGKLTGTGTLIGSVISFNGGSVRPGGDPADTQTGVFTIEGDYTQQDAELLIRVAGTIAGDEYAVLHVTGAASLDGTLHVEPVEGFVPQPGQEFTVMTFTSRTGEFTDVTGPDAYDIAYTATSVILTAPIPGDLDDDGDVDHEDYILFADCLNGPNVPYPLGCDEADLHTDGDVDAADFAEYQMLFGTGQ
ncbi:MAG: hypothetical protein JXB13_07920 [Phycisphaerae bacterium]|nr:hypothetical protein [Phycisphaerae bacterium]